MDTFKKIAIFVFIGAAFGGVLGWLGRCTGGG